MLRATDSVGASLLLWLMGLILAISTLLCLLELGLSIPKFNMSNTDAKATRRKDH